MSRHSVDLRAAGAKEFLAAHPVCWCGHHIPPGTGQIDHIIPVSVAPELARNPSNWRAAHGVAGCPECPPNTSSDKRRHGQPTRCNQSRGTKPPTPHSPRSRSW